jgi:hypothetical protein
MGLLGPISVLCTSCGIVEVSKEDSIEFSRIQKLRYRWKSSKFRNLMEKYENEKQERFLSGQ